ncbi:MAG: AAA family ATPase [Sphingomonadales bacterium]|nr:AAA family ATPase [Sphingomonadales bacterium]MBK6720584.1 AAA family ATPase [Sphingomonadales bacterium]MBK8861166.1 AAA family ATPase [Sphingomonadales bacterium]MBK9587744.1 AAA family ATPase [Sphingomonadales bacterium]MBL0001879.1 AAA family ATPase [Sphingomonadales bacterium]
MSEGITFKSLHVEGWRQLDNVDVEFHPRLTIITGANGAGKSTLLSILTRHIGWQKNFLSTPKVEKSGTKEFLKGVFRSIFSLSTKPSNDPNYIGSITYSNDTNAAIRLPGGDQPQYNLEIEGQQKIQGLHIDSHRPTYAYAPVSQIPTTAISSSDAFNNYNGELYSRYQGSYGNQQPVYRMKEAIISMAAFGEGNSAIVRNQDALDCYNEFVAALRKTMPESIGFRDLSIRLPDVVLVTESGDFMLDAASGGLMTIFDMTYRLHMYSRGKQSFVVTMDEPENHLHPSMQRSLMRRLMNAFPQTQFVVATHSPFIVSSVKDSIVYALRFRDTVGRTTEGFSASRTVVSEKLDTINRAGNAGEVLREVLGVQSTMPEWVDDELQSLIDRYKGNEINQDTLNGLRRDLESVGQSEFYPEALAKLLNTQ